MKRRKSDPAQGTGPLRNAGKMGLACASLSLSQKFISLTPCRREAGSRSRKLFGGAPDAMQTGAVAAQFNTNPLESTLTNSLTSPVVTGKLVSVWVTPVQTVYWKWRGGGIFREVMWWPDKPQPVKVQWSQKQVPATTDTQRADGTQSFKNQSCCISAFLWI